MSYFPERKNKKAKAQKVKETKGLEFYNSSPIRDLDCQYSVIMGERSNGKTYDAGKNMITEYFVAKQFGETRQSVYLRRWKEDLTTTRCGSIFNALMYNGYGKNEIEEITGGEFDGVCFKNRAWYLTKRIDDIIAPAQEPFCFAMSLSDTEHDKGRSYPHVYSIYFDEFIPMQGEGGHLVEEFKLFTNTVSTVMRRKEDFHVFMMANTISRQDLYFREMGLYNVRNQQQGTIEVYNFGDTGLRVAVELCGNSTSAAKSEADKFFAFESPSLQMITNGTWSLEVYPHLPFKYAKNDVVGRFFVVYDEYILEAEIVQKQGCCFIYIHNKTTPIKDDDKALIYAQEYDPRPNWRRNILKAFSPGEKKIRELVKMEKVYFQDNPIGDVFNAYLNWCKQN